MTMPGFSPATEALGLGDQLQQQVAGETEEERKKRMAQIAQQRLSGMGASPATSALFGGVSTLGVVALLAIMFSSLPALAAPLGSPCLQSGPTTAECDPVNSSNPLPVSPSAFPTGAAPITGNAAGSTSAVVGTLAAAAAKTTYICGFNVQAIGGTATVGPITVAGLKGSSQVYQTDVNSATVGKTVAAASFSPCIPASAVNTAITITTTADGTATAVDVNSWGYQQ